MSAKSKPTIASVLDVLKANGLLDRAHVVRAGDVEVHLGPPMPHIETPLRPASLADEERAYAEGMYGASRGIVPGLG